MGGSRRRPAGDRCEQLLLIRFLRWIIHPRPYVDPDPTMCRVFEISSICCNEYPRNTSKGERLKKTVADVLPKLLVVWRNPQPIRCSRRWEMVKDLPNSTQYMVQEFLSDGELGFWYATFNLELSRQSAGAFGRARSLRAG